MSLLIKEEEIKILYADVYSGLINIKDESIDCAITSPPYWGQRDYGFEGQIGNENTYLEYISKLLKIYNLLRQKLKKEGIFFLNIGDKYILKYGITPLGMIPYKLAYFMKLDGWILEEIIIWYKPNHMPSSIKNRFTNSYEPVFVFSKNKNNCFAKNKESNPNVLNILKINLKPTPYGHTAAYPENLILNLLNMIELPDKAIILDPFAGSGTTQKVLQDINMSLLENKSFSSIGIENNLNYINIIKERCFLNKGDIIKYEFYNYNYKKIENENFHEFDFNSYQDNLEIFRKNINKNGFIEVYNNKINFYKSIALFFNGNIKKYLNDEALCFLGTKDFDIELIYNTSLLNKYGWNIRNMIVVEENKKWFPIFMIVQDNKTIKYRFNYKNLELKSKNGNSDKWKKVNYLGYEVVNNLLKNKLKGYIIEILEKRENGFPKYVIVKWEDGKYTKEFVIYTHEEIEENIEIINFNGKDIYINEKTILTKLNKNINYSNTLQNELYNKNNNKHYNGKFKNEKRKNWGASPGARASVEDEYFTVARLYEVSQPLVADYLNLKRKEKHLSKKDLTNLFPDEYKHTVGHWLRKDFGGSIPLPEDWQTLTELLKIDVFFTNYVCKTALKLQTVRNSEYKLPDDFILIDFINELNKLII